MIESPGGLCAQACARQRTWMMHVSSAMCLLRLCELAAVHVHWVLCGIGFGKPFLCQRTTAWYERMFHCTRAYKACVSCDSCIDGGACSRLQYTRSPRSQGVLPTALLTAREHHKWVHARKHATGQINIVGRFVPPTGPPASCTTGSVPSGVLTHASRTLSVLSEAVSVHISPNTPLSLSLFRHAIPALSGVLCPLTRHRFSAICFRCTLNCSILSDGDSRGSTYP
jgi:hypothetical protein